MIQKSYHFQFLLKTAYTLIILAVFFITPSLGATRIKIIAHRGASFEEPENTIRAFDRAHYLNADFIELDVHLSKDKVPIVVHDLKHAIDKSYLSSSPIKLNGERVPTLKQVLEKNYPDMGYMIELKEGSASEELIVKKTMQLIEEHDISSYCIGSSSLKILQELIKYNPHLPIIGIVDRKENVEKILNLGINHLAIHFFFVNKNLMTKLRKKKIKIWVWTVDDLLVLQKMVRLNVDGLITNNVQLIKSYLY